MNKFHFYYNYYEFVTTFLTVVIISQLFTYVKLGFPSLIGNTGQMKMCKHLQVIYQRTAFSISCAPGLEKICFNHISIRKLADP